MDRLLSLTVLVKAVELGALTKAAAALGISPSGASQHIRALEDEFGVRLLERTTRRLLLTEAGEHVLDHARRMLEALDEAKAAAAAIQSEPRGRLRVSIPVSYGARRLGEAIALYLKANPAVRLDVVADDRKVDLVAEGFDVAIRVGRLDDSTLIAQKLAPSPLILCCAPDFLSAHGAPERLEDIERLPCLEYGLRPKPGRWRIVDDSGQEREIAITGPLTATNGEVLRIAATSGLGIIFTPAFIVEDELRSGRLIQVLAGCRGPDAFVYALRPPGRYTPAKVRRFVDMMKRALSSSA